MKDNECDIVQTNCIKEKKIALIDGYTIKYHANKVTIWSKGKMVNDLPEGYWEWYRIDGTLKRSGYFRMGIPVGDWKTYDSEGKLYKTTKKKED